MDARQMVETTFAADFSPAEIDVRARTCVLATVLAYHPSCFAVPMLAVRVRLLAGEDLPVEKAIVDLDRVGATGIVKGVVCPTDRALALYRDSGDPKTSAAETLRQVFATA